MAEKIEITIVKDYVQEWGVYEGVREIIQNGIDGQEEYGCELKVNYTPNGNLAVENVGGSIPREALLLGFTTKRDDDTLIGKFGEGLKLGVLALIRAGKTVKIKNNGVIWTPCIEQSDKFNAEVLKFKITKATKPSPGLRVLIGGISREDWNNYKQKFLVLKTRDKTMINTAYGDLLTDPKHRGRIYVKGIEVETHSDLYFGYNLTNADVDRDRKMISSWDLEYQMGKILGIAVQRGHKIKHIVYRLLKEDARDVKELHYADDHVAATLFQEFVKEQGKNYIPVANEAEAREIEHYGRRGFVVPAPMAALMRNVLGDMQTLKQKLCDATYKIVKETDLTETQLQNYNTAMAMINKVATLSKDTIKLVVYKDNTLGQYINGDIRISVEALNSLAVALQVLVHEHCHAVGADGEKRFVHTVETRLAQIAVANMQNSLDNCG